MTEIERLNRKLAKVIRDRARKVVQIRKLQNQYQRRSMIHPGCEHAQKCTLEQRNEVQDILEV